MQCATKNSQTTLNVLKWLKQMPLFIDENRWKWRRFRTGSCRCVSLWVATNDAD